MDLIKNEDKKESLITLEDFPFICRICCLRRNDLRLFEEEDYLFDLFHTIRKIDASSRDAFPRNICNGCINKLEDLSLFIDISKFSNANFEKNSHPNTEMIECAGKINSRKSRRESVEIIEENEDQLGFQAFAICRLCSSSAGNLTPFEDNTHLMQLFQNITDIDLKAGVDSSKINNICSKCNNELEKISSFISSSLRNDQKLEDAVGTENTVQTENYSNPIDTELSTCHDTLTEDNLTRNLNLQQRMIIHSGKRPKGHLQEHKHIHSEGKPFKCSSCQKSFCQKWTLDRHLVTHTGGMPFKCDLCGKRFSLKGNFNRHILAHSRKKTFNCGSCEDGFNEKHHFLQHLLTHAEEKLFGCECCEKSFLLKQSLQKHYAHSHNKVNSE